jgi:hypothetical protein
MAKFSIHIRNTAFYLFTPKYTRLIQIHILINKYERFLTANRPTIIIV